MAMGSELVGISNPISRFSSDDVGFGKALNIQTYGIPPSSTDVAESRSYNHISSEPRPMRYSVRENWHPMLSAATTRGGLHPGGKGLQWLSRSTAEKINT